MEIITISRHGVKKAVAQATTARNGQKYFALTHGEQGRGRWQLRLPLAAREFPSPADAGNELPLNGEYKLVDLKRTDPRGNPQYLIALGKQDGKQLVLWELDPGYRGHATYKVEGQAQVIAKGEEAQGDAGRMGGADCPLVLVAGPCTLSWSRKGRLYGTPADWVAVFDGEQWTVAPAHECAAEEAALSY